jgi:Mrp family chromosome partitioning ATPase
MTHILEELKKVTDVIVLDGPPTFVSDALALAAKADAVLAVVRPEKSPRSAIALMKTQLQRAQANVLGVVVNVVPGKPTAIIASRSPALRRPPTTGLGPGSAS